jgi:hypothetical protein
MAAACRFSTVLPLCASIPVSTRLPRPMLPALRDLLSFSERAVFPLSHDRCHAPLRPRMGKPIQLLHARFLFKSLSRHMYVYTERPSVINQGKNTSY